MPAHTWTVIIALGYVAALVTFSIVGIAFLRARRKTKWPFKESDKLLRGPGEGLRRRILQVDEAFGIEFAGSIITALVLWPVFGLLAKSAGFIGWKGCALVLGGLLAIATVSAWRITRLWKKRANYFLGWFGERLVAEKLRPLQLQGYRIFHDVPCEPGNKGFNIDHVVVGPTGVSVIEVKTRRKGAARSGFKDHEVFFDGMKLVWPWGEDRHDVQQTLNESDWLRKWITQRTGLKLAVKPILTLPGWYVHETPSPEIRVVNPDFLPGAVSGRGEISLQPKEIDLIARQLDLVCRDVDE